MKETIEALNEHIRDYLTGKEINFKYYESENGVFSFRIGLEGKMQSSKFEIYIAHTGFTLRCSYPVKADSESPRSMARAAEYLHRCSYGMRNGCFELDYSDGEAAYRLFHNCMDGLPSDEALYYCLALATSMLEHYAEGFLQTLYTDRPVEEIAQECDRDVRDAPRPRRTRNVPLERRGDEQTRRLEQELKQALWLLTQTGENDASGEDASEPDADDILL